MVEHLHIVGGGLAGLSAAVEARKNSISCTIYEATKKAGGRIRQAGNHDNGTHLIVKGYEATFDYLNQIGMSDSVYPFGDGTYSFIEPASNLSWKVKANHFVWQVAKGSIPGVSAINIVGETAQRRLWEPFFLAVFNTHLKDIPAQLRKNMFFEMLKQGPSGLIPYFCHTTLEDTFVRPLLNQIDIKFGKRLTAIDENHITFKDEQISFSKSDTVILALPPQAYIHISSPFDFSAITCNPISNFHFDLVADVEECFIGLIGTQSQWLYAKGRHACVTISNQKFESSDVVEYVWMEIRSLLGFDDCPTPPCRIICEKHATPAQNMDFTTYRPQTRTHFANIFLAGDWIDTGLPATIESAIRSGKEAVKAAIENKR
ncbi:MAG: hydroxysqualene dehydroxylase [Terasakiella sp.]|uniref:hydroxysqualene dehydroxylase n=1 Tax=unclassified Terasakiella TaxID=2614952 RepID=UPI003B005703